MTRGRALALFVGCWLVVVPASAQATWQAQWVAQSDWPTLESGGTHASWFDAKNTGTDTWKPLQASDPLHAIHCN